MSKDKVEENLEQPLSNYLKQQILKMNKQEYLKLENLWKIILH